MPRRRAVRVIGAAVAALAIPGVSPRVGRAATPQGCPPGRDTFCEIRDANGQFVERKCCPYPEQRYACGGRRGDTCIDGCPPFNPVLKKKQKATWSSATYENGRPKKYNCCPIPDFDPVDGECVPSCRFTHGPGAHRCGKGCCPRTQRCVRHTGECKNCPPSHPLVCGPECCDPTEEECLDVDSARSSNTRRRQCVEKCAPGKRRCIASDGQLGECCPIGYPCCGTSCGCDGRQECVQVIFDSGPKKMCRPKCRAPEQRCNYFCCTPDRMYNDRNAAGRTFCRCRPRP